MNPTRPITVRVFAFPGVRLLDVTGPIEVFTSANDVGGRYRLEVVSQDGGDVITSAGTRLGVDRAAAGAREPSDVLIIPGGPDWATLIKDDALLDVVRRLTERAGLIASVCTGAFLLAAAGLLDGRRATTHWRDASELALRFPAVQVEPDAIFVTDGPLMTSAGVSAGIDLSLAIVERQCGPQVARAAAKDMVVFMQRPGGQSQFSARAQAPHTRHQTLRQVLDAVVADPAGSHTVAAMGRRAGLSARQVTRLFSDEVGVAPARYVEQVRIEAARAMLETGDETIEVVARRAGFGSPESLRRAFTRHLGVAPSAYRASFLTTGADRPEAPPG
jgi:transcriptional regulator GlxA family with amidase domain